MRRKLFDYTAYFIAGVLVGYYCLKLQSLICITVIIGSLIFVTKWNGNFSGKKIKFWFFVLGVILMMFTELQFTQGALQEHLQNDETNKITGKIIDIQCLEEESYLFTLDVSHEKLLCSYYAQLNRPWALLGCVISFYGKVEEPEATRNPRCFDYKLYLRTQGIGYLSTIGCFDLVDIKPSLWYRIQGHILEKRDGFLSLFSDVSVSKGILRGLLFGDTEQMDEDIYDTFRQNGTAHVLAVSGLHIGMLYGIYRKFYVIFHSRWITAAFLFILLLYGMATLWSVSVTRAIILICLVMIGDFLHRRYDLLTALAAIVLLMILNNPYIIFAAGFQMSFLAVVSIVFLQKPMEYVFGQHLSTSVAVQIGLMPYMAYVFNYVSLVGLICNIPVVFLTSLIVPVGLAAFVLYFIGGISFSFTNVLLNAMTEMLTFVNELFSADSRLSFDVISPPLWVIVLIYGGVFYGVSEQARVFWFRKQGKEGLKPVCMILIAALFAFFVGSSSFDHASIVFVDVGQGDCVHIKDDCGRTVFIDGGGNINYNVGERTLKPYLLKNGFSTVELAAATHLHTDHYLGLEQLESCFDVNAMLTVGKAGDIIQLSSKQWLEILWPLKVNPDTEDENLNSLIFMIHDHGVKTLITGDITEVGENLLLKQYRGTDKLQADILKIAHHGSKYSTSDEFLNEVQPKIGIISVGRNNYGHPSEIVIEKLSKKGIMVFRTDLDGAVGIINRKGKISVCTEKQR